ncbi:MAG: NUDIX domain-containing protein [Magnetococcales bacterium]|nr:NUDIX domain-containing protein [Magnetococcales bacterium]MBF0156891.1 NUDIX domain-containing protein [Magnetococcales bacterium]
MDSRDVELLGREVRHEGFLRLVVLKLRHRLFAGGWSRVLEREVVERPQSSVVLPYDPVRDEVVVLEQFRPGTFASGRPCWQWEPVGGLLAPGESPLELARRETREETGLEPIALEPMGEFLVTPGITTEIVHCYCARVDTSRAGGLFGCPEEDEDIRVRVLSLAEVEAILADWRFGYGITWICWSWLVTHRRRLLRHWGLDCGQGSG